ncbi:hypothetical protein DSECCO2_314540 [anaerobic digester metagenome]|nr:hypothetical protein [Lentimicrobium sp.]
MGERIEEIKSNITQKFPKLLEDEKFEITSNATPDYNCIAWACLYNERWIQPPFDGRPDLDCVTWWPPNVQAGLAPVYLIKLFEHFGYEVCDSYNHEDGYRKVALYYDDQKNVWTHAARELSNGFWTSKLGPYNDIQHCTPLELESDEYGIVYCYMKKRLT